MALDCDDMALLAVKRRGIVVNHVQVPLLRQVPIDLIVGS